MNYNLDGLYERIDGFTNKYDWIQDSISGVPFVGDDLNKLIEISKMSNRIKLDYAWRCISNDCNVEHSINMIYKYVSDKDRAFYISNEFRKIVLSSSLIAASIIAYIMGRVVYDNRKCTHSEIIISNALMRMTDYDLDNLIYLCNNCVDTLGGYEIIDISNVDIENVDSFKYTLQICVANGIFEDESAIIDESTLYEGTHYKKPNVCNELLNYIDAVKQIWGYRK